MPANRQNQPEGRQNGGVGQGGGQAQGQDQGQGGGQGQGGTQGVAQRIQEGASAVGERFQEGYGAASQEMAHRYRQAEGMIARNPGQSVMVGFGVGFGLGVLLSVMLSRREETWYERYMPDSLRDLPGSFRGVSDRVRHGAETVASYIPGR